MDKVRMLVVPVAVVAFLLFGFWWASRHTASVVTRNKHTPETPASLTKQDYVLEVIGLGVTVDKYRQGALWRALQQGKPFASIRELDPNMYPWSDLDKIGVGGSRACDALENGANASVMYWGVPTFYAGAPIDDVDSQPSAIEPLAGMAASAVGTGMAWHLFVTAQWNVAERPDQLLSAVFDFFDTHPDLPYVVLLAEDSLGSRNETRIPGSPSLVKDGYYVPVMPDASSVFVLARRERVDPIRPYVWEDADNEYLQENLRRMYFALGRSVPTKEKLANPEKEVVVGRQPSVSEWLQAASTFAKHPIFKKEDEERSAFGGIFSSWTGKPPKNWKPTPWFPLPWNEDQLATFDRMPTLGFLHRPVFVKFEDAQGRPVKRRDQRQKLLEAGWQEALQTLPEAERKAGPARIIAAFADNTEQRLALEGVLHRYAEQGGPEIDTSKSAQFINTDHKFGNSGAATFFVQMAIGVMGSHISGGTSAAINLRDPGGASIVFISPPPEDKRVAQNKADVFKHQVAPAIDPENYKMPSMESLINGVSASAPAQK